MKPQTLTEKILSRGAGRAVQEGEYVWLRFDATLTTDISAPITINIVESLGVTELANRDRIHAFTDHYSAPPGIKEAGAIKLLRDFCSKHAIPHFYEIGRSGVSHAQMLEDRLIRPGELLAGTDSHTCSSGAVGAFATGIGSTELAGLWVMDKMWLPVPATIRVNLTGELTGSAGAKDAILTLAGALGANGALQKAIEFGGPGLSRLSMRERFTLCNMGVEIGATNALCEIDEITLAWFDGIHTDGAASSGEDFRGGANGKADPGAEYAGVVTLDLSKVVPVVARPYSPDNIETASKLKKERVKVDQVYVGTCTNGSFDDIKIFADSLRKHGPAVDAKTRAMVVPSSQGAFKELLAAGIIAELNEAGCQVMPPGCGACIGTHWGVMGDGEAGFFTSNRNFRGRTGSRESRTYLGSPYLAGIAAARGFIDSDFENGAESNDAVQIESEEPKDASSGNAILVDAAEIELFKEKYVKAIAVKRDNINTDEIIPARYCNTVVPEELAPHVLEDYDSAVAARITPGAVLVGKRNFGCGSSREVAAVTLAAAGVGGIVAGSFGAIFERNCINNALPVMRSVEAVAGIDDGDRLVLRAERGELLNLTKREKYLFAPFSGAAKEVLESGSLSEYITNNTVAKT